MKDLKINMLILSGKEVYVVAGLAVIGAGCIVKVAYDGVCTIKDVIQNNLSGNKEESE
jgi:hypothetical protein